MPTSRPRAAAACTAGSASGSNAAASRARPSPPPCWPTTSGMPRTGPKAFAYALEAAEAALDAYAFNNAIAHLNDALKLLPEDADDATRYRLWDMLGTAYGSSGRLDDAIAAYGRPSNHAGDRIARATAHYGIGEAYHRKGDFDDADPPFRPGAARGGIPAPARACRAVSWTCG